MNRKINATTELLEDQHVHAQVTSAVESLIRYDIMSEQTGDCSQHLCDAYELRFPDSLADEDEDPVEVMEYWIVSDWLARKLEAHGETICYDYHGMTVWGRTTSGQPICLDGVILTIADGLEA